MDAEQRALKTSIAANAANALLGFGFFVLTESEAILLDGFFSLTSFFMGFLAIRIASLLEAGDDEYFQFGYASFEPMFNTVKGAIILAVCLFAAASAIGAISDGGRAIEPGWGTVYAALATAACFVAAVLQRRAMRRTGSRLIEIDARAWTVDAYMSLVVFLAFVATFVMSRIGLDRFVPYADPALVLLLTVVMLPVPVKIVLGGLGELLRVAPPADVQKKLREKIETELGAVDLPNHAIRMARVGREFWILIHVIMPPERMGKQVSELDGIRQRIHDAIADVEDGLIVDVVFTAREEWV